MPRKPRKAKPLEKEIQATILKWLTFKGAFAIRVNSGAVRASHNGKSRLVRFTNRPGCSDILCCLWNGRFAAIEVKRPGEVPTDKQREFLQSIERSGGIGVWVTSVDELELDLKDAGCL
jgi:hypothetical protein